MLSLFLSSSAMAGECQTTYVALSTMTINTLADYQNLEKLFLAQNALDHRIAPPVLHIPATTADFAARATFLQNVAKVRMGLKWCQ